MVKKIDEPFYMKILGENEEKTEKESEKSAKAK
jgi:hypothetical protein